MKVLITGATSFIGKHLVNRLYERYPNNHYIGICNHSPNDVEQNWLDLYYVDLCSPDTSAKIREMKPDLVYHLAAISSPGMLIHDRLWNVNVNGTLNLLNGIKCPIIFASTANIYGEMPHLEEQLTTFYSASKKTGENLIETFVRQNLISAGHCIRLSGVVGPNMTHGLLPVLIKKIKNKENPINLLRNTRKTYIHINDVVDYLAHYIDGNKLVDRYKQFTLSNKDSLDTTEVAELIYDFFNPGQKPVLKYSGVSYVGDIEYSHPENKSLVDLQYPTCKKAILAALESYK